MLTGRRTLERGAALRSRNAGGAIPRGESGPCDPRRPPEHRHIGALGTCRPDHPYSPRQRAQREHERSRVPASRKRAPDRAVPARLIQATKHAAHSWTDAVARAALRRQGDLARPPRAAVDGRARRSRRTEPRPLGDPSDFQSALTRRIVHRTRCAWCGWGLGVGSWALRRREPAPPRRPSAGTAHSGDQTCSAFVDRRCREPHCAGRATWLVRRAPPSTGAPGGHDERSLVPSAIRRIFNRR